MILHAKCGLIWTLPWPDQKDLFLKFFIREIRKFPNLRISRITEHYQNIFFFYTQPTQGILHFELGSIWTISTRQAIAKIPFFLHSINTGDTPYRVWLDLEIFLNRGERTVFEIPYSRNSKSFLWNTSEILTILLAKLLQKFLLPYTLITLVILHAKFGLIWTLPWPDEKELFLKFIIR